MIRFNLFHTLSAIAILAAIFLIPWASIKAQVTETALRIVLVDSPLTGGGNETTGHVKIDPTKVQVGTATVLPGATTGAITFGSTQSDTSFSLLVTATTNCTPTFYVATKTTAGATLTLGAAAGITNTFDWLAWDR